MVKMKKLVAFLIFAFLLVPFVFVQGGILPDCGYCKAEDNKVTCARACNWCDFFQLIINIINFLLFSIAPPLAVLFLCLAGFILIAFHFFPGETTEKSLTQAKEIIKTVIFALALMYGAYLIVDLFFKIFAPGLDWKHLPCG